MVSVRSRVACVRDSQLSVSECAPTVIKLNVDVQLLVAVIDKRMSPDGLWVVMRNSLSTKMLSVMSASAAAGVGVATAAGDGGRLHRHVGVARELAAQRDRQVRLHSVHTDLELDLPPSIALPDGEELPYGSSARLHIRDPEQESEIYQKCIRPPPNRTVFESESPPPYRSSSAGLLGSLGSSSSSGTSDWSAGSTPLVVRCHSMSSSGKQQGPSSQKTDFLQRTVKILTGRKSSQPPAPAPTLPVVVVPTRPRRLDPRSPHV